MTEKLQKELNEQITAELWSANLYLSMAYYMLREGYEGFAHWLKKQAAEEISHADKIAEFMVARGGIPKIDKIDVVPQSWGNAPEAFEAAYKHELHMSKLINRLVKTASEEEDNAALSLLWWFVGEQVEEEAQLQTLMEQLKKTDSAGYLFADSKLAER